MALGDEDTPCASLTFALLHHPEVPISRSLLLNLYNCVGMSIRTWHFKIKSIKQLSRTSITISVTLFCHFFFNRALLLLSPSTHTNQLLKDTAAGNTNSSLKCFRRSEAKLREKFLLEDHIKSTLSTQVRFHCISEKPRNCEIRLEQFH